MLKAARVERGGTNHSFVPGGLVQAYLLCVAGGVATHDAEHTAAVRARGCNPLVLPALDRMVCACMYIFDCLWVWVGAWVRLCMRVCI